MLQPSGSLPTRRVVRINVRTLAGSRLALHVDEDETVDHLQVLLEEQIGIPAQKQILCCEKLAPDWRLRLGHYLCEYELGLQDEVVAMMRLPPMPPMKAPTVVATTKALTISKPKQHKTSLERMVAPKPGASGTGGTGDRGSECEVRDKSPHPGSGVSGGNATPPTTASSRPASEDARGRSASSSLPGKQGHNSVPAPSTAPKTATARSGSRERFEKHGAATLHSSHSAPVSRTGSRSQRIRRVDLECVGRLGVGAFGVVTLEEDRRSGKTYALKAVSKGYLVQLRMVHSVLNEKRILKMVDSPFIVRLYTTYNGREHVYFLLEAALGGELFTTYERLRLYGSERHARFYVGCVVEALVHLHDRGVIYRDLKPENLLLDTRGYCKLTDMGLAKVTKGPTYTLVGTPDYMAPEVINGTGHNQTVDWWMLGVLLFELMVGRPPFEADSADQVYELVRKGIERVHFPPECRHPAPDLVRALCRQNAEARLYTPKLRRDPWFQGFEWASLREQRMQPPRVPTVRSQRDLSNFRTCDNQGDPPLVPYQDTGTNWDADFEDDLIADACGGSVQAQPSGGQLLQDSAAFAGRSGVHAPHPCRFNPPDQ